MRLTPVFGAAIAAVSLLAAGGAGAATIVTTFTGTIISGLDNEGLFGPKGANLRADSFTSVFTTTTGGTATVQATGDTDGLYGGATYSNSSPTSAVFTVFSGSTVLGSFSLGSFYGGLFANTLASGAAEILGAAFNSPTDTLQVAVSSEVNSFVPAPSIQASVSYAATGRDSGFGVFASGDTHVVLASQTVTSGVVAASAIPEPMTWALMTVGFGGLGAMLRRHQAIAGLRRRRAVSI